MNYFTGIATSPTFEFPYSGYPVHSISNLDSDINAILANIAPPSGTQIYNQPASCTMQCVPQINTGIGDGTVVYQVPENMPIDMILQQLGINSNTLQPSDTTSNYYRTGGFQLPEVFLSSPSSPQRPRRLICREATDSDDDGYLRRPSHRRPSRSSSEQPQQSPPSLHNILSKVWQKAEQRSQNLPPSVSAPDLNSQWQGRPNRTPPPPNSSANNVWQAMRNASGSFPPDNRNAVNNVWQRADHATEQRANHMSDMFNRMRQPTGNINQPPPSLQNREAVQDFMAARNLPYGINAVQPNREAVHDFMAARNLPYGVNAVQPNREAVHDFMAARNLPYGVNAIQPNQEAVHDFMAARNLPYGVNAIQPNREAVHDFMAARNLPYGVNAIQPNQEAVHDFMAARNLPYGVNAIQPNREAVHDFMAARNVPYGVNAIPPNQEAVHDFMAARNVPYGVNAIPPNREAVQDFNAVRNLPYGINQPNPAVANAWNRADYAVQHAPPMINIPWNQGPTSSPPSQMNNMWNRMQQGSPAPFNPPYPISPMSLPPRGPNFAAPTSFASVLSQAHRQHLPYAGAA